jgi:hypothetical protein
MADEYVARLLELRVNTDLLNKALQPASDEDLDGVLALCAAAYSHRAALRALPSLPRLAPAYAYASGLLEVSWERSGVWAVFPTCRVQLDVDTSPRERATGTVFKTVRTRDWLVCLVQKPHLEACLVKLLDLRSGSWSDPKILADDAACLADSNHVGFLRNIKGGLCDRSGIVFGSIDLDLLQRGAPIPWSRVRDSCSRALVVAAEVEFSVLCVPEFHTASLDLCQVDSHGLMLRSESLVLELDGRLGLHEAKLIHGNLCAIATGINDDLCIDLHRSKVLAQEGCLKFGDRSLLKLSKTRDLAVFDHSSEKFGPEVRLLDIDISNE